MTFLNKQKTETYSAKPPTIPEPGIVLARNSAYGPAANVALTEATPVTLLWNTVESTIAAGTNIPVTVVDTGGGNGTVRVVAMVGVSNLDPAGNAIFTVNLLDGGTPIPPIAQLGVDDGNPVTTEITFVADVILTAGLHNLGVRVEFTGNSTTARIDALRSSIDVQQLRPATG